MILTAEDIEKDITGFKARISEAMGKLNLLPAGHLPYQKHRQREKQRKGLQADIEHIRKLMGYANEALETCEG